MERFDFSYAPYDSLYGRQRQALQQAADIAFFEENACIISPKQPIEHLYVVIKGAVKEISHDGEVIALYRAHDTFDARALVEGSSQNQFVVAEEALVYLIPKAAVNELVESNTQFGAYFYASVAEKLASLAGNKNENELAGLFNAHVYDAYRQNSTWLEGSNSILQAASIMKKHKTKSLLIRHEGRVGLLTESIFRDIMIAGAEPSEPAYLWANFNLISVDINDFIFNALLRMMEFRIQRVIVTEQDNIIGTLEQIDLLAYLSNHSHLVAQRLEQAETIDDLTSVAQQMTDAIRTLKTNGVRAPELAQLMQVLNTSLFDKTWKLIAPAALYENACLIVMGSEGRGEQVLKTDQDNALILPEHADLNEATAAAEQFSATLSHLGYPPCRGQIMVNNPEWRKPLNEFKNMVTGWCREPSPEAMMKLAIFLDARAVAGNTALLMQVNTHLRRYLNNDAGMLMTFARAIEQFDGDGQGFFSQLLRRGRSEKMDVKKMGLFPIVHGVRALALEAKIEDTGTFQRLEKLTQRHVLDEHLAKDITEALRYLMDMRLKAGLASMSNGQVSEPNQVDLNSLSTLERDLLKEALQVVKRFKNVVRHHFHLNS